MFRAATHRRGLRLGQTTDVSLLVYPYKRGGERAIQRRPGEVGAKMKEKKTKAVAYGAGRRRARVAMRRSAGQEAVSR